MSGLSNRRGFSQHAARVLQRASAGDRVATLAYTDLDGFKQVNDTLGHDAGDEVIAAVGAALRRHLRPTDVAARLGGDEFAVLFADELDEETASKRVNVALEGLPHGVSGSVGIASRVTDEVESLLVEADAAMYEAQAARRAETASPPTATPLALGAGGPAPAGPPSGTPGTGGGDPLR